MTRTHDISDWGAPDLLQSQYDLACRLARSGGLAEVPDHARLALEPLAQQIGQAILIERTLTALREREASLNAFFDRVSDFLFVLDERGDILRANETAYRQLGWDPGELEGRSVLAVRRASGLCQRMLATSGREQLRFEHVDCGRLVREIVSRLVPPGRPDLAVTVTVDPRLPAVKADEQQLGHAISHLLQSAIEALDKNGGRIAVRVGSVAAPSPRVLLAIEDDGCGMSDATCARMFEPFFSTKFVGRGLGAAAAHGVVAAHDGTITVQSAAGKGTTVTLALPALAPRTAAPASGSGSAPQVEDEEVVLDGRRTV